MNETKTKNKVCLKMLAVSFRLSLHDVRRRLVPENATFQEFHSIADTIPVSPSLSFAAALSQHHYGYQWHGEVVWIDSEEGAHTCFWLFLV
jgi:hypothetical protein